MADGFREGHRRARGFLRVEPTRGVRDVIIHGQAVRVRETGLRALRLRHVREHPAAAINAHLVVHHVVT